MDDDHHHCEVDDECKKSSNRILPIIRQKNIMIDSTNDLFIFIAKKLTAKKLLLMINDKSGEVAVALCSTGD